MNKIFVERLIELRVQKDLNQRELAKIIDVTQAGVSRWERGERTPDIVMLEKLAKFFDVSADYLLGLTD